MRAGSHTGSSGFALVVLGWITIAFWLSTVVFPQRIPPLAPWPALGGLLHGMPAWIRQLAGLDRPDREIVAAMDRELLAVYAFQWLLIAVGVTSGALLIRRRKAGWRVAFALCAALLGWWVVSQTRMLMGHRNHLVAYWTVMPRVAPWTFASWVFHLAFYVVTLVTLALHGGPSRGSIKAAP